MSFTVDVGGVGVKIAELMNNKSLGLFMASEAMGGMDPYVPYREGNLARSAQPSPFRITYTESYAKRVYEGVGMKISKEQHPLATKKWDQEWCKAHSEEFARATDEFIRTRL